MVLLLGSVLDSDLKIIDECTEPVLGKDTSLLPVPENWIYFMFMRYGWIHSLLFTQFQKKEFSICLP